MVLLALATPATVLANESPTVQAGIRTTREEGTDRLSQARDWIMGIVTKAAPPGRKVFYPGGQETKEEALSRYESIANDIIQVVYNPKTTPLFTDANGRARTVSVILSVMLHESGFMRHVDFGLGRAGRGDHGQSWCSMQIKVGTGRTMKWNVKHDRPVLWNDPKEEIFEGYTGEELLANRQTCIAEGLKVLRVSFGGTKGLPLEERLRIYASGDREKGLEASRNRMRTAMMFFATTAKARTFTDAQVIQALDSERRQIFLGLPPRETPLVL